MAFTHLRYNFDEASPSFLRFFIYYSRILTTCPIVCCRRANFSLAAKKSWNCHFCARI